MYRLTLLMATWAVCRANPMAIQEPQSLSNLPLSPTTTVVWLRVLSTELRRLSECVPRDGAVRCFKLEAVRLLHSFIRDDTYDQELDRSHVDLLSNSSKVTDNQLSELLLNAMRTVILDALAAALPETAALQQRGRQKKYGPLMLAMLILAGAVVSTVIGKTAMVAGKALAVSILALLLAVVTGFRRANAPGAGNANYEVLALSTRRHVGVQQQNQRARNDQQLTTEQSRFAHTIAYGPNNLQTH